MGRTCCVHKLFLMSKQKQFVLHNMFSSCSELVVFMYWTGKSMNNLLPYCGLVDVRINTSDKDLPVRTSLHIFDWLFFHYLLKLIFRLNPLTSATKSNGKLVNQKVCNTVLILDKIKVGYFQKKIGIIYRLKQICCFTILNSSFEFPRFFLLLM
jgi:hypothetical protein